MLRKLSKLITSLFQPIRQRKGLALMARLLGLLLAVGCVSYALGQDLLVPGGEDVLKDTLTHSGKRYLLVAEGLLSLAAYIRSKNLLVLFGIVIVSVFFNIVMGLAGIAI